MKLRVENKRDVLLVYVETDRLMDMRLLGEIRGIPAHSAHKKWKGIVLDFSQVEFINSAAISAILGCSRHVDREKKGFVICGLRPRVLDLFEISRLNRLIAIRETIAEAEVLVKHWTTRSREQILKDNVGRRFDDEKSAELIHADRIRRAHLSGTAHVQKPPPTEKKEKEIPEPGGEWNKISVARPGPSETQELKKKYDVEDVEDPLAKRLNPLFDALRQLRKVVRAEGLDIDLNSSIGEITAQFVDAVRKSVSAEESEESDRAEEDSKDDLDMDSESDLEDDLDEENNDED